MVPCSFCSEIGSGVVYQSSVASFCFCQSPHYLSVCKAPCHQTLRKVLQATSPFSAELAVGHGSCSSCLAQPTQVEGKCGRMRYGLFNCLRLHTTTSARQLPVAARRITIRSFHSNRVDGAPARCGNRGLAEYLETLPLWADFRKRFSKFSGGVLGMKDRQIWQTLYVSMMT